VAAKTINDLDALLGSAVVAGDYLPVWDTSGTTTVKVLASGMLQALATVTSSDPLVLPSSLTVEANGTIQSASGGLTIACGAGNMILAPASGSIVCSQSDLYIGDVLVSLKGQGNGILTVQSLGSAAGFASPANTPAQIAGDVNNYSPGVGLSQRWSSDASRNVTGMVAGIAGEWRWLWNVGAQNIVIVHNSGSSSVGNKFANSTDADITIAAGSGVLAQYDAISGVWRVKS
jgi:hypothetical protein